MTAPAIADAPIKTFESLEKATKVVLTFVGLLYALGLLVSNEYLLSLGISDFTAVRPKYVLTGAWGFMLMVIASLPLLLPTIMAISYGEFSVRIKRSGKQLRALRYLFAILIGAILSYGLGHTLFVLLNVTEINWAGAIPLFIASFGLVVLSVTWTLLPESKLRPLVRLTAVCCIPLLTLIVSFALAHYLYDRIPEALGGGKPIKAELVLTGDGVAFWQHAGLLDIKSSNRTPFIYILFENDKELVIRSPYVYGDGLVLEKEVVLNKTLVDGILPDMIRPPHIDSIQVK